MSAFISCAARPSARYAASLAGVTTVVTQRKDLRRAKSPALVPARGDVDYVVRDSVMLRGLLL